jgi:hypothetical protein
VVLAAHAEDQVIAGEVDLDHHRPRDRSCCHRTMPAYPASTSPTNTCGAARDYGLEYRALKAIARNALIYSFLDEAQKRDELARFDRASAEFERSVTSRQSPLQNAVALIKAAVTLPP